jgi:hypothetical protein
MALRAWWKLIAAVVGLGKVASDLYGRQLDWNAVRIAENSNYGWADGVKPPRRKDAAHSAQLGGGRASKDGQGTACYCKILETVAIEIGGNHACGGRSGIKNGSTKGAVAVAQLH